MRKLIAVLVVCAAAPILAGFWHGSAGAPPVTNSFAPLQVCGGGWNVGAEINPATGVRFVRTDTFSAYLFGTNDNSWHNVITKSSFPTANFGLFPTTGASQVFQPGVGGGVLDIAGAPSTSTTAYLYYGGKIFVSTNVNPASPDSITWTDTGLVLTHVDQANGSTQSWRQAGRRLAVDPNNRDHVLIGTMQDGVWETTNATHGGGATWTQISTGVLPLAQLAPDGNNDSDSPAYQIAFDPASGVNGSNLTNKLYIFTPSASNSGLYATTNGATASLTHVTAGGPTVVAIKMKIGQTGGQVWIVDGQTIAGGANQGGSLWQYSGGTSGTWTHRVTSYSYVSVAIEPHNANHMALSTGGGISISTNAGVTWSANFVATKAFGDSPWQTSAYIGLEGAEIYFDPLQTDHLFQTGGQGFWDVGTLPTGNFTQTALSKGIEQWTASGGIAVPTANHPTIGGQDVGSFAFNTLSNSSCMSATSGPNPLSQSGGNWLFGLSFAIIDGISNFTIEKISADFGWTYFVGTSTDGFATNHTPVNSFNRTITAATDIANNGSGLIRLTMNTTGLTTWSAGAGSILCSMGSNNKSDSTFSGFNICFPVTVIDGTHADLQGSSFQSSITSTGGAYFVWVSTSPLSDWNGQGTITAAVSNGGKIKITVSAGGNLLQLGGIVCITGVAGTTEANGCWPTEQQSGSNVTLTGSTFTHTYTGGGVLKSYMEPGGSAAISSSSNFAVVGGDRSRNIVCTTDGGQTWSEITNAAYPVALTTVTGGPYSAGATSFTVVSGAAITGALQSGNIYFLLADGRTFQTPFSVATNTVTITNPIPTGATLANGTGISTDSGYPFAAFLTAKVIAADRVTPNTFYAINNQIGILKWTNCGSSIWSNQSLSWNAAGGDNVTLTTAYSDAGHLFYTVGSVGSVGANHPAGTSLYQVCNGTSNVANAFVMHAMPGVFEAQTVGTGKPAPGQSYDSIYMIGWYAQDNTQASSTYGVWRQIDNPNHGNTGTCTDHAATFTGSISGTTLSIPGGCASCAAGQGLGSTGATPIANGTIITGGSGTSWTVNISQTVASEAMFSGGTWKKIDDWPNGWNATSFQIQGDPYVYGEVYMSTQAGAFIGMFN